jgi:hypothetical protein
MCPLCITTAALTAASTTSGVGVIALAVGKWRKLLAKAAAQWRAALLFGLGAVFRQ